MNSEVQGGDVSDPEAGVAPGSPTTHGKSPTGKRENPTTGWWSADEDVELLTREDSYFSSGELQASRA